LGVLLAVFLATAYYEVERAVVRTAALRSRSATDFLAGLLTQSAQQRAELLRRTAADAAIINFLSRPGEPSGPAQQALARLPGARRAELWNASGQRVLESVDPAGASIPAATAIPTVYNAIKVADGTVFSESVEPVRADGADTAAIGHVLVRTGVAVSPPGIIERLVGTDAVVYLGDAKGSAWTDLTRPVVPPRADRMRHGMIEYDGPSGTQLGLRTEIRATPLALWVAFPLDQIVAPARTFAGRMSVVATIVLLIGGFVVWLISARITSPLDEVAVASQDIAARDYSRRVHATRKDEIGRLARAFNAMVDELEKADHSLKSSDERRELILAAARVGLWEFDLETGIVHGSETMPLVHGSPEAGRSLSRDEFLRGIHPDVRAAVARVIGGDTGGRSVLNMEFRTVGPDGSVHWIEGVVRARVDDNGRPISILGASLDVTEHRSMEAQLRQSQKMDAVGQLAGGMAHDFNNLLTAILGYGNLALESLAATDPIRRDIDEILKAGRSASALTQQLLAFGRRQVMQPAIVDVNEVVASTDALLKRLIGEQIEFVTVCAPTVHRVKLDPAQLQQVLLNLALNARDAMPNGGQLTIETANVMLDEQYAREHPPVVAGPHVLLTVTDTGTGMDAATQARIFEPFFTTKATGKGTGLGLSTVYGIVKQSGGHIYVYSELGRGTTFKVYFPATSVRETATPVRTAKAGQSLGGHETILIVEDNEQAMSLAQTVLMRLGYHVLTASTPRAAIDLLKTLNHPVDLVLSDVIMPGMTGPDLMRQLMAIRPGLKVLFTSGYSDDAIVRHGVLSAGTLFLQKPYTPAALAEKVREALA